MTEKAVDKGTEVLGMEKIERKKEIPPAPVTFSHPPKSKKTKSSVDSAKPKE